ncbi:MAG: DUF2889 domain-containing protein [Deltaproteobacteria bacterium]|jgi:hypothetical protein|nr:DUF2889 domain-containing protein [Deltaproteobacteria bacterium]
MMNLVDPCRDRKIHTRKIEISTYEYDEKHVVVEGILKDDLLIPIYVSRREKEPHSPHHMMIHLLIACPSLVIRDINVKMPTIPYDWCTETSDSLDLIKGLKIEPGFTSKVKKILRESKRCLHLTTLIFAIVPTVMQGYWTYNAKKPSAGDMPSEMMDHYLIDTCWVWRKGGPRVKMLDSSKV